jgi:hypothetical protein
MLFLFQKTLLKQCLMHDRNCQRKITMCANDEYQRTSNKKCIVDIVDINRQPKNKFCCSASEYYVGGGVRSPFFSHSGQTDTISF